MGKKSERKKRKLKWEGNLTIYEAVALREKLNVSLEPADILEIDIGDVGECDTSGLQILCSAKKTADLNNKKVHIPMMSGPVQDAMIRTGITRGMIAHDGGTGCQK